MKKVSMIAIAVVVLLAITGCTTFKAEGLSFSMPNANEVVLTSFEKSVTVHEFAGPAGGTNLFNITADAMSEKVAEVVMAEVVTAGGNGARNITIEYKVGFLHMLVNAFTGYIWAPTELIVTGDVVYSESVTADADLESEIDVAIAAL